MQEPPLDESLTAARQRKVAACLPVFLGAVAAFVLLLTLTGRFGQPGDAFKAYLIAYALFRFGVEFVRDNPEMAFGLSGSQIFLLMTIPLAVSYYSWRLIRRASASPEVAI